MGFPTLPPLPPLRGRRPSAQMSALQRMARGGEDDYLLPLPGQETPVKKEPLEPAGFFKGFGRSLTHGLTESVPSMFAGSAEVGARLLGQEDAAQTLEGFRSAETDYK